MNKIKDVKSLLQRVEEVTKQKELDLSSGEDLSIGVMNLISIEEHLFFTSQKTKDRKYMDLLDEVRRMRTELLKEIIKDYEGEVWCISKHLLAASMRIMEVGTKELKKGDKDKAWNLFDKSYKLYSLFWGLNLGVVSTKDVKQRSDGEVKFVDEKSEEKGSSSVFSKLGSLVQKAIDCCKE
ncbi:hypothetical protein A3A52_01680 [Candidatus Woesebacteria bacterium RIFCSPLOWO2_01_FULL_39_14]|uniref:Uncharacterized protein n=1 Tax=Candidatus Woesebacteria bacterium RIFCSPLOWO2_01_FULL_39_14 TaxID=1802518 RepID=A0A1F8BNP7_9BACT|nr:MAG: hypothetical protein A3A52_01680 [Candidatus Woesebacteria bacterium RIFCSPLOWO2_01_FULL_39_14]